MSLHLDLLKFKNQLFSTLTLERLCATPVASLLYETLRANETLREQVGHCPPNALAPLRVSKAGRSPLNSYSQSATPKNLFAMELEKIVAEQLNF
ncbi:hypothetical protein H6H03_25395 [Nostoc paludosum FACHB-159]|uniref:Uncharacterized protein n=1 Tax=Nostoc paludosum FACHB-159 TaxID=2692908 RepID=A0ABR8KCC1_9NOSO|nr:hypothetical protein [Nostoc paludosum FACHB-159]